MTEVASHLSAALADRYVIERELGAGGMPPTAERRNGGTAAGNSDG